MALALIVGGTTFDRLFADVRFDEVDGDILFVYAKDEETAVEMEDTLVRTNDRFAPERAVACSGRDTTQRSRLKFIDHSPRRSQPGRLPRVFAEGASEECGRVRRRRVAAARSKCLRAPGPQAPNARETSE
jgi:hypothetical protein